MGHAPPTGNSAKMHQGPQDIDVGSRDRGCAVEDAGHSIFLPALLLPDSPNTCEVVGEGPFTSDLRSFLRAKLHDIGPFEIAVHTTRTRVVIHVHDTAKVLGTKGERIRHLESCICRRYDGAECGVAAFAVTMR